MQNDVLRAPARGSRAHSSEASSSLTNADRGNLWRDQVVGLPLHVLSVFSPLNACQEQVLSAAWHPSYSPRETHARARAAPHLPRQRGGRCRRRDHACHITTRRYDVLFASKLQPQHEFACSIVRPTLSLQETPGSLAPHSFSHTLSRKLLACSRAQRKHERSSLSLTRASVGRAGRLPPSSRKPLADTVGRDAPGREIERQLRAPRGVPLRDGEDRPRRADGDDRRAVRAGPRQRQRDLLSELGRCSAIQRATRRTLRLQNGDRLLQSRGSWAALTVGVHISWQKRIAVRVCVCVCIFGNETLQLCSYWRVTLGRECRAP